MKREVGKGPRTLDPILRTKLYRPPLTAGLIDRGRLIRVMNRARDVPLTLVSAPAGYGKSVLVAQWAEQLDSPVAWLSLDASDSEPRAFLQYFLAAVDTVSPGACDATREARRSRAAGFRYLLLARLSCSTTSTPWTRRAPSCSTTITGSNLFRPCTI